MSTQNLIIYNFTSLYEILEELDARGALAHRVLARVERPHKVERIAKRLLAPRERGVDDVLAVAGDDGEAAVRVVDETLRVDLADVELLRREHEALAVGGRRVGVELLDVNG